MDNPRATRYRRLAATAVVLAAVAALPGLAGAAGASEQYTGLVSPAASPDRATTAQITLVTGDTVEVVKDAGGKESVHFAADTEGASKSFQTMSGPDGDLYVIPEEAMDAIASNAVDRELFNVTRLIKDGYADSRTDSLPVIVGYADRPSDATLKARADKLPAADRGALLESVDMTGEKVDKKDAEQFWRAVKPVSEPTRHGRTAIAPNPSKVSRLWYDGKVKASLDKSVPQIGAPEAWAKGVDGKGVKVAVLDTGVDLDNADVKGRVTATSSFVPGATVQDGLGHGTHVASTIVGSGANSGGKYKGVAPGADLLVGKVLTDGGGGLNSWIANGMEWAAAQGADVVSMSLGGSTNSPSDPMTQVVDRLSATTGTLFVISAGNSGPGESTISSPGTADSALTVGAVDKSDALAGFSSRGPRVGDSAIKPEITAPGVNIVAARATGTAMGTPVDANYTAASGTSMAAPHVAGAAALLAQRHPDWTGQRIKAALVTHAKPSSAYSVYQQGNGRVDVPAALDPALELSGTADFGLVEWQKGTYDKETCTVTVTNTTDSATTVTPTIGGNIPQGAVTVPGPVEVAAGASAEITVTLDPNLAATGLASGTLTLTSSSGATAHTAVGLDKEIEKYNLTVHFKDRRGQQPSKFFYFLAGMSTGWSKFGIGSTDKLELRVPAQRYSMIGGVLTQRSGDDSTSYASDMYALPTIDLTSHDAELTVDGTKATDFKLDVRDEKRPLENSDYDYSLSRTRENKTVLQGYSWTGLVLGEQHQGAIPVEAPKKGDGGLWASFYQSRREPLIRASVTRPDSYALTAMTSDYLSRFDGRSSYDLVDVGAGTEEDLAGLDLKGKAALLHLDDFLHNGPVIKRVEAAGAAAIVLAPTADEFLSLWVDGVNVPYFAVPYDQGRRLTADVAAGRTTIAVRGVKESRYQYAGQYDWNTGIPANLSIPSKKDDYAKVRNSFHSNGAKKTAHYIMDSWGPAPWANSRYWRTVQLGTERDDYRLARPDLTYQARVTSSRHGNQTMRMVETARGYRPGTSVDAHWWAPVQHPSVAPSSACSFCRSDVGATFDPGLGGDSDPTHSTPLKYFGPLRTWTYYRNGEQVTDKSKLFVPEKADYTFVSTDTHTDSEVRLGGRVVTEYGFTSAAPKSMEAPDCRSVIPRVTVCEALPVIQLDYRMNASLLNEVAAGTHSTVTVDASRAKGFTGDSRMAGAKFSVSYDDGATWKSVDVDRADENSFRARFTNAKLSGSNGYVSVKAEVWDAAGNRTVQTVNRAYALK
ncbi:S8 family serine peptidase [Streptomyces sp. BE133]|uniref:S8 family serine peptidase n=1 Tax=Streptomyces sp. BE133 TaxID=3002523 RepID=UPI002E78621A|nr:S8 family serine peptidase [Streptomyces sp. BE133]MEE1807622.1 S8 family serine peptidase [Streptomyces sp. BE133]